MDKIEKIEVISNGQKITYDVLFTFVDDVKNKIYVVYTDNSKDSQIYAALYNEKDHTISHIDDATDQKLVSDILEIIKGRLINND